MQKRYIGHVEQCDRIVVDNHDADFDVKGHRLPFDHQIVIDNGEENEYHHDESERINLIQIHVAVVIVQLHFFEGFLTQHNACVRGLHNL